MIVTDRELFSDARAIADKLNITVRYFSGSIESTSRDVHAGPRRDAARRGNIYHAR